MLRCLCNGVYLFLCAIKLIKILTYLLCNLLTLIGVAVEEEFVCSRRGLRSAVDGYKLTEKIGIAGLQTQCRQTCLVGATLNAAPSDRDICFKGIN